MAKKKFNWKKFKKKALKANKKIGKWVNANINPDVLSGNADRIFAPQGEFGIQGIYTISSYKCTVSLVKTLRRFETFARLMRNLNRESVLKHL